jgi:hypothetical protein
MMLVRFNRERKDAIACGRLVEGTTAEKISAIEDYRNGRKDSIDFSQTATKNTPTSISARSA